ncbi:Bromodomain-containing protein [Rhizopus microsporus var. microsporus]|uniref:Bromodomain-containing protein n=2 Tax=Rhizopus microsporus TaxID=58291 RepID=A0A2G4SFS9_RHIZD|nr:Bromodomain-containing protein [Rhizopus microsporus ATCC 52813]ORE10821.1 Bromodomain-containing protein [Rhizopus microsporus var. microsporus]PHZ07620.1 Bromodomain-containing protein [Rhizopus microsporus ATCC 52813]
MSLQDRRLCSETLNKLWKHPCSFPFQQPVDPVLYNIPDYFDIIKHPMDLSTIEKKMDEYKSKEEFIADVELMFYNCFLYNNPTDPVCDQARELEKLFKKQLPKLRASPATDKKEKVTATAMPDEEYKHCESVVKEFKKPKYAHLIWPFERPVDADAWGATDYYDIIKRPMDLSTIERKFNELVYNSEDELHDDFKLMFENCYLYNPPQHEVHLLGKKFESAFDKFWSKLHGKSKERSVKKQRVDQHQELMITPPTTQDDLHLKSDNNHTTSTVTKPVTQSINASKTTTAQTGTQATPQPSSQAAAASNDGRNVLRIKLNVKKPEEAKPTSTPSTSAPHKSTVKIPGLALSKEPPTAAPKLALDQQPPSPLEKKEQRPALVLQNHDKWVAQAKQHALQQQQSYKSTNSNNKPVNIKSNTVPSERRASLSRPPEQPKPSMFDIGELYNKINDEKRLRQQQLREEQERREREERARRERDRLRHEEQLAKKREFLKQMAKRKEREKEQRLAALNERVVDISAQKMISHKFESNILSKDLDWRELISWQRDTVDYRHIPVPAFIRRSHLNLQELRSKLLSKSVRLKNARQQAEHGQHFEYASNNGGHHSSGQDSDMDVE